VKENDNRNVLGVECYVFGFVEAKRKVESLVEEIVLECYGVILNG